jgi:hypothetical protein
MLAIFCKGIGPEDLRSTEHSQKGPLLGRSLRSAPKPTLYLRDLWLHPEGVAVLTFGISAKDESSKEGSVGSTFGILTEGKEGSVGFTFGVLTEAEGIADRGEGKGSCERKSFL